MDASMVNGSWDAESRYDTDTLTAPGDLRDVRYMQMIEVLSKASAAKHKAYCFSKLPSPASSSAPTISRPSSATAGSRPSSATGSRRGGGGGHVWYSSGGTSTSTSRLLAPWVPPDKLRHEKSKHALNLSSVSTRAKIKAPFSSSEVRLRS
jgi:hypothetical protein